MPLFNRKHQNKIHYPHNVLVLSYTINAKTFFEDYDSIFLNEDGYKFIPYHDKEMNVEAINKLRELAIDLYGNSRNKTYELLLAAENGLSDEAIYVLNDIDTNARIDIKKSKESKYYDVGPSDMMILRYYLQDGGKISNVEFLNNIGMINDNEKLSRMDIELSLYGLKTLNNKQLDILYSYGEQLKNFNEKYAYQSPHRLLIACDYISHDLPMENLDEMINEDALISDMMFRYLSLLENKENSDYECMTFGESNNNVKERYDEFSRLLDKYQSEISDMNQFENFASTNKKWYLKNFLYASVPFISENKEALKILQDDFGIDGKKEFEDWLKDNDSRDVPKDETIESQNNNEFEF